MNDFDNADEARRVYDYYDRKARLQNMTKHDFILYAINGVRTANWWRVEATVIKEILRETGLEEEYVKKLKEL